MSKIKISTNCYRGKKIKTIERIKELSDLKCSIYHKNRGIKPAVFMLNQNAGLLLFSIKNNLLYEIIKS